MVVMRPNRPIKTLLPTALRAAMFWRFLPQYKIEQATVCERPVQPCAKQLAQGGHGGLLPNAMNDELQDGLLGLMQALQISGVIVQSRSTHRATESVKADGTLARRATLRIPRTAIRPSTSRTQI